MPSSVNPVDPPPERKPEPPKPAPAPAGPPQLQHADAQPSPDVTDWVVKLNERLSVDWQENELRGGRVFPMTGATMAQANEMAAVFKNWDVGSFMHQGHPCLMVKPRRMTQMPRPGLGQKPGR